MIAPAHLTIGLAVAAALLVAACSARSDSITVSGDQARANDATDGPVDVPAPNAEVPGSTPSTTTKPGAAGPATSSPSVAPGPDPDVVQIEDRRGDTAGGQPPTPPDVADLAAVTVTVDQGALRIDYELVTPPPTSRGPAVLNLVTLVDTDCDGVADHELWATLTDRGWDTSAYRRTDNGDMAVQPADGVEVGVSEATVTLTSPVPDGAASFDWVAAAEDGLVADYRSGDTWRDTAPDSTAAHLGTCTTAST